MITHGYSGVMASWFPARVLVDCFTLLLARHLADFSCYIRDVKQTRVLVEGLHWSHRCLRRICYRYVNMWADMVVSVITVPSVRPSFIDEAFCSFFMDLFYGKPRSSSITGIAYHLTQLPASAADMRRWTRPAMVQIMACRLFSAKPLSGPM